MTVPSAVLAVVFDFDDTLVPDSTTRLLTEHGIDARRFWTVEAKALVSAGFDPPLAYLKLLLEHVGENKALGRLTNQELREFGAKLDREFYPGLKRLLPDLRRIATGFKVDVEFYIVSGGLEAVIQGSKFVRNNFRGVYGCALAEDNGVVKYIKRCVTFTEKTRYLFEINKGLSPDETHENPYLVNKDVPQQDRRIPFKNMIYVGDGLTDIPCFSLVKKEGGTAFGVFNPGEESSAKRAFLEFLKPARVFSIHAPKYNKKDELGSLLRAAVATRCGKISLERREAGSA